MFPIRFLKFKKSVFAGVLDGASDRVFMGESALNRFMKTVETATAAAPAVVPTPSAAEDALEEVTEAVLEAAAPQAATRTAASLDAQSLGELLTRGAQLLQTFGQALARPSLPLGDGKALPPGLRIANDTATGRPELRVTLPDE